MNKRTGIFLTIAITLALIVSVIIAAFISNPGFLEEKSNDKDITPTPLPTPIATSEPTASQSPTPTQAANAKTTPKPTAAPTATPAPTTEPTAEPTETPTQTPEPTATPIPTPSPHPTVDPASILFQDDFASGTMKGFTNTDISGVFLGVKNGMLECSTTTPTNGHWGYVYKWLDQRYDSLNWRWYLYFGDLPTTDGNIIGGGGMYNSAIEGNFTPANGVCSINIVRINGECCWNLAYVDDNQVFSINSTQTVNSQTWYLVELKGIQAEGTGEVHCYVNDEEILSATNLTNNNNAGIDHISIGGGISADHPIAWYCASAIASTEHIGPKPSDSPATNSFSSFGAPAFALLFLGFGTTLTFAAISKNKKMQLKTQN